jgi:hypothetical protein
VATMITIVPLWEDLEHPHPCHSYEWYKWTPHNLLYYFTFFNYLNHLIIPSKYPFHSSKTLTWAPQYISIPFFLHLF